MTELVLIQRQLKKQQRLQGYPLARWTHEQERRHAAIEAMGKALKAAQQER